MRHSNRIFIFSVYLLVGHLGLGSEADDSNEVVDGELSDHGSLTCIGSEQVDPRSLRCTRSKRELVDSGPSNFNGSDFTDPGSLNFTGSEWIHLSMIFTLDRNQTSLSDNMKKNLDLFIESMLNSSTGSPLHLIFITDFAAKPFIEQTISTGIGRLLSSYILHQETRQSLDKKGWKFPRLKVEYVDFNSFIAGHKDQIAGLKEVYCSGKSVPVEIEIDDYIYDIGVGCHPKYGKDLFYLIPLYHKKYPAALETLIILDIDLVFRIDLVELQAQFDLMNSRQLFGVGKDFGYLYSLITEKYRTQNHISYGASGLNHGLNTGVLLLDLKKLRDSEETPRIFSIDFSKQLVEKYFFPGIAGDQDLLNLLHWELPHLIYPLHCSFNNQNVDALSAEDREIHNQFVAAAEVDMGLCDDIKIGHNLGTNL